MNAKTSSRMSEYIESMKTSKEHTQTMNTRRVDQTYDLNNLIILVNQIIIHW
jgi:hypothetical protein